VNALVIAAILPAGLVLFDLIDNHISVADIRMPGNKTSTGQTEAINSSAIGAGMTTLTTRCGEGRSNGL